MRRFLLWVVDRPFLAGGLLALLTLALALQIPRIEFDTSAEGLMVQHDPARQYYEQIKSRFGSDTLTVVLVKAENVFTAPVLQVIRRISDRLDRVEGVKRVESLTTVLNIKGEGASLNVAPLVGSTAPADLERIRRDALGNRVFTGNVVSRDGAAAAIVVYTDAKPGDTQFNERFSDRVEAIVAQESVPGLTIYQIGMPLTKVVFGQYTRRDLVGLIPISLAVLLLILFLAFRTLQGVVIPTVTGLISVVWALGLMAVFGIPVNVVTAIIPSLLITIGFAEDVHMLTEYHHLLGQGQDKLSAIRAMAAETGLPVLVTTSTTVLGFGSLILTDITMMIQFGYAAALGLTANFVVTLVALPIMLRAWPVPRRLRGSAFAEGSSQDALPGWAERLAAFLLKFRIAIFAVAVLVSAASVLGWFTLRVNSDFVSYFPEHSVIRQRAADLHRSLAGAFNFYVVVETGRENGVLEPEILKRIVGLQRFLEGTGEVDQSISITDYLRKVHREMNSGDAAFEAIPDTADEISQYLLVLDAKEIGKYLDFNGSAANIVVRHNITSSWQLSRLLKRLEAYVAADFPETVKVRYTGEGILINNAADYMAVNEITSFSSTFLIIGLIHALLFMSVRAGLLSLIPNLIPVLTVFGVMGLLGIPLNTGTALVATVAIGIAVDDTVHHMVTYARQLNLHHDQRIAMIETLRIQGRPIVYVSLALAGGFLILGFSSFVPTQLFGLLSAFVMVVAMVAELVLTPILMYSTRLVTLWDMLLLKLKRDLTTTVPLFQGLSQWAARKVVLLGLMESFRTGDRVIHKGHAGTGMYVVVSGRVRVFDIEPDGVERTLTVLEVGAVFGEMALFSGGVRTAHVVAEEPVELFRLDFAAVERLRKRFPFTGAKLFRNLAGILSERLRERTAAMVQSPPAGGPPVSPHVPEA
jgi:predicted RND superfamily exporter protein